jgi:DNA-binding transcriptional LysR family regulator
MQLNERIGRRLKLRDLNIFLVVVKEGSMSKAAAELAISQPSVSKSIADMEYTLGAPLLDRTPHGVEPTPYGQALIKRGIAVFDELRQSVNDIESLLDPTVGEVRIGSTSPMSGGIVAAVIERLSGRYPRLSFHVVQGDIITLQRDLHARKIELAVGRASAPISDESMDTEILFADRLLVVAGPRSKWGRRQQVKLAELINEPWVLPHADDIAATLIADAFRGGGVDAPRATVSTDSARLNTYLLASGRFLTVFPESMILLSAKRVPFKVLAIDLPHPASPVVIITMKNRTLSPLAQLFIEHARDVAKPLAKRRQ